MAELQADGELLADDAAKGRRGQVQDEVVNGFGMEVPAEP